MAVFSPLGAKLPLSAREAIALLEGEELASSLQKLSETYGRDLTVIDLALSGTAHVMASTSQTFDPKQLECFAKKTVAAEMFTPLARQARAFREKGHLAVLKNEQGDRTRVRSYLMGNGCFVIVHAKPEDIEVFADDLADGADLSREAALLFQKEQLKLKQALRDEKISATRDPLTQILNRAGLQDKIRSDLKISNFVLKTSEQRQATRKKAFVRASDNRPVTVLMIDIDHFKNVNDTYGHAAGDDVLYQVAQRLKHTLRDDDIIGRFGGEEILAVLPDCHLQEDVARICEKLRRAICDEPILYRAKNKKQTAIPVSISIGAAIATAHDLPKAQTLADEQVYCAKKNGRNRFEIAAVSPQDRLVPSRKLNLHFPIG